MRTMERLQIRSRLLSLTIGLLCCITLHPAAAQAAEGAPSQTVRQILADILKPVIAPPKGDAAWLVHVSGEVDGTTADLTLAWDAQARFALHAASNRLPAFQLIADTTQSALCVLAGHPQAYVGSHQPPAPPSLFATVPNWQLLTQQVIPIVAFGGLMPLPSGIEIEQTAEGIQASHPDFEHKVLISKTDEGAYHINVGEKAALTISLRERVPSSEWTHRLAIPADLPVTEVESEDLTAMFQTGLDLLCETALARFAPDQVPDPLVGIPRVDGVPVVHLRGTPAEMGRQHGEQLKQGVQYNVHRTLHILGLYTAVERGQWLPTVLEDTWNQQRKYIPDRFEEELSALAEAAELPERWVKATNVFPESFHCSGLALGGKATENGQILHGRVLDYMTGNGLQNTAVVMIFEPEVGHTWVTVGYAGFCGTVTAMNMTGLAMGEMGGRGEGYTDGWPMSVMMREIMERFSTTEEALEWMAGIPRTCEYFYVLSDAETQSMAGVASWAAELAAEKGHADLQIVRPNAYHELLPRPVTDTVLLSSGGRYQRLVDRVEERWGSFDMESAWNLMGKGVAMNSNLHSALFAPETLDFWVSNAGLDGSPAFTQEPAKLNLRELVEGQTLHED